MQQFDPNLPNLITGDITSVVVIDPASTFGPPFELANHVVDPTKPFDVDITWELQGAIAKLWIAALETHPLNNQWDVSVYAESLGGGPEVRLGTTLVAPDHNVLAYSARVNVPADTLEEHQPGTAVGGIYKLVVAVFLDSDLGAPGFDITGYFEGPIIQAENPN